MAARLLTHARAAQQMQAGPDQVSGIAAPTVNPWAGLQRSYMPYGNRLFRPRLDTSYEINMRV